MPANVRRLALEVLLRTSSGGGYSNLTLDSVIKKNRLDARDRALLTALVFGVIEKQITLDYYIDSLSSSKPENIEPAVRMMLRLGLYQLTETDRIPAHAAVDETVSLAPARAHGFVNAILRSYLRRADEIKMPEKDDGVCSYLSVKYSFSEPLCAKLCDVYGDERCEKMLAAFDKTPPLTLRVNTLRLSRDELCSRLRGLGHEATPTEYSPYGIRLPATPPSELAGFEEGDFFVQDEASQLATAALDARAGMLVVDICAAPGSKSFGAAICMENKGKVISCDLHENKLSLIEDGAERLGIGVIETCAADGRIKNDSLVGKADRVICDVPCSGFGVMAKKPEIRHKSLSDAEKLPPIQYAILDTASAYLRCGGRLVYSTCTVFPEENEKNIERFLAEHGDFSLTPTSAGGLEMPDGMLTLAPDTYGTDGFFIAVLTRN